MVDLYLVTDDALCLGRPLTEVVEGAVKGGVTMVQLREKDMDTRDFIDRAVEIKKIAAGYGVPLIINDRIDVALAVEADGVHIGQHDMPYACVRKIIPEKMILGLSVETVEQAVEAENYNLDYLSVSPLFFTPTKTDLSREWGIDGLREICKSSRHPVIAIGGINSSNAAQVIRAGADGIAVVSAICSAPDPGLESRKLISIIKEAKKISSMTDLPELGEFGLIKRFSRQFIEDLPGEITGIGDDCAVIPLNDKEVLLFTTDMLIEDRHFILDRIGPRDLGKKSLAVNLSDIAAMGGEPHSAFLSIGIPAGLEITWLDHFFAGIRELCLDSGTWFLGGDTTGSPDRLVINIGVVGRADPSRIKKRSTALPGDVVCVNDKVGDSGGGMRILLDEKPLSKDASYLVDRHHCPRAHLEEGKWLAKREQVHAMIDLSDGIESDIHRIMESSACGAEIELSGIPVSYQLSRICDTYHWDVREIGISGGEDYCLMFTVPEHHFKELEREYAGQFKNPLYRIGRITGDRGTLNFTKGGKVIEFNKHGYDHFKAK